jgi:hypothetical protein
MQLGAANYFGLNTAAAHPRVCSSGTVVGSDLFVFGGHKIRPESQIFETIFDGSYIFNFGIALLELTQIETKQWSSLPVHLPITEHSAVTNGKEIILFGNSAHETEQIGGYTGFLFSNYCCSFNLGRKKI